MEFLKGDRMKYVKEKNAKQIGVGKEKKI